MERIDSDFIALRTDIMNAEKIKRRSPSPATSYAGSDSSVSASKLISAAEATVHERNDVMLRLMGHLIPSATDPEEGSVSETDNSIASSPSTLKRRLHNLPASNEAVKLADRVAALNRRIRRERDLYLHLQGVTNRIEEKDETDISTTDSSRTINSISNRHRQGQSSNPRARRRERLNSVSAMSQHQNSSDLQLYSPGFSSPEPLTLTEIRQNLTGQTDQFSSPIGNQQSFEKKMTGDIMRNKTNVTGSKNYFIALDSRDSVSAEVDDSEFKNSTDFNDVNYPEHHSITCNVPPGVKNVQPHSIILSNASSDGLDSTYVRERRTPKKFGGYRPGQGLIFRNLSSDSESDAPLEQIAHERIHYQNYRREDKADLYIHDVEEEKLRDSDFILDNSCLGSDRRIEVEPFVVDEQIEILEGRRLSPIPSADSKLFVEDSKVSVIVDSGSELQGPQDHQRESQDVNVSEMELSSQIIGNSNHQSVLNSVRSSDDLENPGENSSHKKLASDQEKNDDIAEENACPEIPRLKIESQSYSKSQSLSCESKHETTKSSLDVNALIHALSNVSLKREKSTHQRHQSALKLKSPLGYGNRFSESSGPRSSEYTPAAAGSRQSLTSLEVSETHSVKISNDKLNESKVRRRATPSLTIRSNKHSARSTSRTPETSGNESIRSKKVPMDVDLSQGSSFIPVVAKVNRTNLVCPKHPLRIKSIGKLISPRKYPNTDFTEALVKPLQTSRTDVSQSSEDSRNSFRSLRSVRMIAKIRETETDNSKPETDRPNILAPLSGRRILEPLNSVPKLQPDLLINLNRKFERRKKSARDFSEIADYRSDETCSRKSLSSRKASPDTHNQSKYSTLHETPVLSGRRTPGEYSDSGNKISAKRDQNSVENFIKSDKCPTTASGRSSVTSENVLCLLSERLSMSSGGYEGKASLRDSLRDEGSAENDNACGLEDGYDQQQLGNDSKILSTNSVPKLFRNCVHLDDLQDGREVTLPCGNSQCREKISKGKQFFERLPDEISASLTRNASFGTQVTENLNSSRELPSTFEDLRKNLQDNNDQWIKDFGGDHFLPNSISGSADEKIISISSNGQFIDLESQKLLDSPTISPLVNSDGWRSRLPSLKTDETGGSICSRSCPSSRIYPKSSECSSPLYADIRQESEYNNSDSCEMDSQRTSIVNSALDSLQNTHRSIPEYTELNEIRKFDDCHFETAGTTKPEMENFGISDVQLAPNITNQTNVWTDQSKARFSVRQTDLTSDVDDDHEEESISENDEETSEATPCKIAKLENCASDTVPNLRPKKLEHSENDCDGNNQLADKVRNGETTQDALTDHQDDAQPPKCDDIPYLVRENRNSPSSTRSVKAQGVTQHHEDAIVSSPVSVKSFLSMSKLKMPATSRRDIAIVVPGASSVRKSQDRFPFTISESASRKTSKYKVVTDMSLEQLLQNQNSHAEHNDLISLEKSADTDHKIRIFEDSSIRQLTPNLEELTNKMSNDVPDNPQVEIPTFCTNYISYGCDEESRTLLPTMKEMVKKLSAKLRSAKRKRCHDSDNREKTNVEILYRNKKCRCSESTEGSSSVVSLYQSQILESSCSKPALPDSVRQSDNGSRTSSGKTVKPKRNLGCISMSMQQQQQHSPKKGCDRNDLWIQEFDSDLEFDEQTSTDTYCKILDERKTGTMPRTSSPIKDRYSMFLARRRLSGIIDKADDPDEQIVENSILDHREAGDNERVNCKSPKIVRVSFNETQELVADSPRTLVNSFYEDNVNESESETEKTKDDSLEDSPVKTGCCCFKIYRFLTTYKKHSSKSRERTEILK